MNATVDTKAEIDKFSADVAAAMRMPIAGCHMGGGIHGDGGVTTSYADAIELKDATWAYPVDAGVEGTRIAPPKARRDVLDAEIKPIAVEAPTEEPLEGDAVVVEKSRAK